MIPLLGLAHCHSPRLLVVQGGPGAFGQKREMPLSRLLRALPGHTTWWVHSQLVALQPAAPLTHPAPQDPVATEYHRPRLTLPSSEDFHGSLLPSVVQSPHPGQRRRPSQPLQDLLQLSPPLGCPRPRSLQLGSLQDLTCGGCNSSSQEFARGAVWSHFTDKEAEDKGFSSFFFLA